MKAAGWMLVTAPTAEPLSVLAAKEHLRVDSDNEDFLIADYITAARMQCEELTSRAFLMQTWDAAFMGWPGAEGFILPRPPLASVTSIQYTTAEGQVHTLATDIYQVITATEPGRVILAYDREWPAETLDAGLPIVVRYVCGTAGALAWQAQCVAIDETDSPQRWRLRVERESLRQANNIERLQGALTSLLGAPAALDVEAGVVADSAARRDAAAKAQAQQAAEATIHNDPLVRSLIARYPGAAIVPGSIRPV